MQGDFPVDDPGEKDRQPFRHDLKKKRPSSRGERIFQERTLDTVAVLVGYQKRKVPEVLEPFHAQDDGRQALDFYGRAISAEETNE
jgi:hypothetical protein